jgi:predicted choloylglycine hydrolase
MELIFRSVAEAEPGAKWRAGFARHWPSYRRWYVSEGAEGPPPFAVCLAKLRRYMPELVFTYERLCELAGLDDLAARFLSLYRPPAYLTGCSQIAWTAGAPMLARNYDYSPTLCEGQLLLSAWHGRRVMAMTDCLWGVLDGVNEAGLAISLTFGGRPVVGDGFGVPLLLRYVLEFCDRTKDAIGQLTRIPSHMAYNVTVLDRSGDFATVMLAPDRPPAVTRLPIAANHQMAVEWADYARATATLERERFLFERLGRPGLSEKDLLGDFLAPPLYTAAFERNFGTLYTAAYWPAMGRMSLLWPGDRLDQSIARFIEGERARSYGQPLSEGRTG